MSDIISRLFPDRWDFGGPERQGATNQTAQIREELTGRLDQPGKNLLESLTDAYIRETNCEIRDAYKQGVFDGMELMMEYGRRQGVREVRQESDSCRFPCSADASAAATASDKPSKTLLTDS